MLHEINSVSFPFLFIVMLYYIQRYAWTFQDLNGGAASPPFFVSISASCLNDFQRIAGHFLSLIYTH